MDTKHTLGPKCDDEGCSHSTPTEPIRITWSCPECLFLYEEDIPAIYAAAPELLEALREILDNPRPGTPEDSPVTASKNAWSFYRDAQQSARAAIDKAVTRRREWTT